MSIIMNEYETTTQSLSSTSATLWTDLMIAGGQAMNNLKHSWATFNWWHLQKLRPPWRQNSNYLLGKEKKNMNLPENKHNNKTEKVQLSTKNRY
jgi:hypothetical protein